MAGCISVLILTRNEERDLPGCLQSVSWSDDVHVFDSFSTDGTVATAAVGGARVTQRAFDGYASQRNAALRGLHFQHDWVLSLDADERVPDALAEEMRAFVQSAPLDVAAARIRRRDFFMGTWLRHAQLSPYFIRLVRPRRVHYEREINEVLVVDGRIHDLREPFDHFPFSKGVAHWIDKHNRYSTMEAELIRRAQHEQPKFSWRSAMFARDFNLRRVHQKGLFYRLPCRPLVKLIYLSIFRRAFLDGTAGVTYAVLQSIYEYFIVLRTRELRANECAVQPGTVTNPRTGAHPRLVQGSNGSAAKSVISS
jgi:glycosyltransferase involved in cell wall biosynthesis